MNKTMIIDDNDTALPSSIGIVSLFWRHADDKCKRRNSRNNHRLARSSKDGIMKGQIFYQAPPRRKSQENNDIDNECAVPSKPAGQSVHSRPVPKTKSQENTERLEPATSTPRRATWSGTCPEILQSALKPQNGGRSSFPSIVPIRHVRFSTSEIEGKEEQATVARALIKNLPWTDHRGICGSYTGQMNDMMRPDGRGALVYYNGEAMTCIWKDGAPVSSWAPKQRKSKKETSEARGVQVKDTFLPHLDIGDIGDPRDMAQEEPSRSEIDCLRKHDFAFVKRSDGESWTYAIIASRKDDSIHFVVDTTGSTKTMSRKHWSSHIRVVMNAPEEQESPRTISPMSVPLVVDIKSSLSVSDCHSASWSSMSSIDALSLFD